MNEIPQDVLDARNLLEEAENDAGSHRLFCRKYLEALETLQDYREDEADPGVKSFIDNVIISHGTALFKKLPSLELDDPLVWLQYTAIVIKHQKRYLNKIYKANPQLEKNVKALIDEWIEEIERLYKKKKRIK
jgi:DNA-binding transcriptional MerR regulator